MLKIISNKINALWVQIDPFGFLYDLNDFLNFHFSFTEFNFTLETKNIKLFSGMKKFYL